jgi:RimJ/RimL family protein N-acetyltransferase
MMLEPGERQKDLSMVENVIRQSIPGSSLLLFAEEDEEIVGFLSAQRGRYNRLKHSAYLVVGIRKAFQGKGIGTQLFAELDAWAKENQLKRLELTVMCPNQAATHLYEKAGFEIEGIKKYSMLVDGEYVDEYYMAKIY